MKISGIRLNQAGPRLVASALIAATLALAPGLAPAAGMEAGMVAHTARSEQRINDMHSQLKITAAQEEQWAKVAQAMTDNAKAMDTLTQARKDKGKGMTAVDDLRSYGEIADAHAEGIRKLTPAFATLYEGMSPAQKVEADTLFRRGSGMSRGGKHGYRNGPKKGPTNGQSQMDVK